MKKSLYSIFALVAMLIAFTSCEKDEVQNTATVEMAGEWHVHVTAIDPATGEVADPDWFGDGNYNIATFNTASNVATEMWLQDAVCSFFPYQVLVKVDPATMTFSAENGENIYGASDYGGEKVTISGGKIVKNGTTSPSGMPVDYIEFYVSFSDDPFPDAYGVSEKYLVSGFRYTGFVDDE